jgi:hypothetical protein
MTYLLDANVFIEAKQRYYAFDFHPGFWDWLLQANAAGTVCSVEKVAEELRDGGDDLANWVIARDARFFLPVDEAVVQSLAATSTWAAGCGQYDQGAIAEFLDAADYYLVSHAHAHQDVVVTHEVRAQGRKRIKIPNACDAMNVQCMTPYEMFRATGVRFVSG